MKKRAEREVQTPPTFSPPHKWPVTTKWVWLSDCLLQKVTIIAGCSPWSCNYITWSQNYEIFSYNDCILSPVLQTLVHDVPFVGRLQVVSPGQQHSCRADRADHQVERFLQVHLPCAQRWGQSKTSCPSVRQNKPNRKWSAYLCSVSWRRWLGLAGRPPGTWAQRLEPNGFR